ncbi:hypothetical protein [Rhizobium multihospitium]|uniref:Uncharacterized protein n=1 Tax=Rhizobium multihospitium TaxID=410764 RepID=A0A1C3WNQ7_9HYPH|nr:hypothetical protein [Rhizobium multihospitium]SCB41600.1 hypothetical protein GA0061103_5877 [Rhizobium multihospitium]
MNWENWGPALLSSSTVAALTILGSHFLKSMIEQSVKHGFDRQIETLRADIKSKEEDLRSLRSGALSALSAKHEELDRRRIKAAESLWRAVIDQRKYRSAISTVAILNIAKIDETIKSGGVEAEKMRTFAEVIWQTTGLADQGQPNELVADVEQLFVSDEAWLAFDALRTIGGHAAITLLTLKNGLDLGILKKLSSGNDAIKKVLPEYSSYIDQYPEVAPLYLVDQLQEKLLRELRGSFSQSDTDYIAVNQARHILSISKIEPIELANEIPDKYKIDPPPLAQ